MLYFYGLGSISKNLLRGLDLPCYLFYKVSILYCSTSPHMITSATLVVGINLHLMSVHGLVCYMSLPPKEIPEGWTNGYQHMTKMKCCKTLTSGHHRGGDLHHVAGLTAGVQTASWYTEGCIPPHCRQIQGTSSSAKKICRKCSGLIIHVAQACPCDLCCTDPIWSIPAIWHPI